MLNKLLSCNFFLMVLILISQVSYCVSPLEKINEIKTPDKEKIETLKNSIYNVKSNDEKFEIYYDLIFLLDNSESLIFADSLIEISKKINKPKELEIAYTTKALYEYSERNFENAIKNAKIAEKYNNVNKDEYRAGNLKLDIGNIYFHSKNYYKAEEYFYSALNIFSNLDTYEAKKSYVSTLYNLSKVSWAKKDLKKFEYHVNEYYKYLGELNDRDKDVETAYYEYVYSGLLFEKKEFKKSIAYLKKALPSIIKNNDFTNEHVIYLYIGKNYWKLNQREKSIEYFKKIDNLFKKKKFLNYELREAYDYLIDYYRDNDNIKKQLEFTESLIILNRQFEREQNTITNTLHYEYETIKLEDSKSELNSRLANNNKLIIYIISCTTILLFITIRFGIKQKKEKKKLKEKYDNIIDSFKQNTNELNDIKYEDNPIDKIELTPTEFKIIKYLRIFEIEKKYLSPVKLEDLIDEIGTSKTTLSQFFNNYKDGFSNYINNLRINEVLIDLKNDENLRELSIENISQKYGYNNSKTFFNQFKRITGIPPTYYIKQLNIEEKVK